MLALELVAKSGLLMEWLLEIQSGMQLEYLKAQVLGSKLAGLLGDGLGDGLAQCWAVELEMWLLESGMLDRGLAVVRGNQLGPCWGLKTARLLVL